MEVSGHIPQDVSLREAIEGGMRISEHFIGARASVMPNESLPSSDFSPCDERTLGRYKSALQRHELLTVGSIAQTAIAEGGGEEAQWEARRELAFQCLDHIKDFGIYRVA